MQVCFVALPYQNIENPVLSLSLLQAILDKHGLSSRIFYANMHFAESIGLEHYYTIARSATYREALLGEFIFATVAFGAEQAPYLQFLELEIKPHLAPAQYAQLLRSISVNLQAARSFVEQTVQQVLEANPAIVACASTTQQNCACLAFCKMLKARAPHILTVMGGPNCERAMGAELARSFPFVDYVISGEADSFFGDFCSKLLQGQRHFPEYPMIFTAAYQNPELSGYTQDLNQMPYPNFDDYFAALAEFKYKKYIQPGLLIETSRGCWWGMQHPCVFCGMNGASRCFRQKSPERALAEYSWLYEKYQVRNFFAVDCILSMDYFQQVLPALGRLPLNLMYEIKTNLTPEQITALAQAHIRWAQPGIESLQDDLLQLMNKGNKAIRHIEVLRELSEAGIRACWLALCCFPGEQEHWFAEQLRCFELITHLQPPDILFRLRYDRFSVYEQKREQYNLQLQAAPAYRYIYPEYVQLDELAYFFVDAREQAPVYGAAFTKPSHRQTFEFIRRWQASFASPLRDRLEYKQVEGVLEVLDLRAIAVKAFYTLDACQTAVALACRQSTSRRKLEAQLSSSFTAEQIEAAKSFLLEHKLLLQIGDDLLFLPVNGPINLPPADDPPAGNVDFIAYLREAGA